MRLILFTGKGGVGKSSLACATAARLAELGRETLIVSSDLAHNLGDIFDQPVGSSPKLIAERLHALEVDILKEVDGNWDAIEEYSSRFLVYLGMEDAVAEEVVLIPGIDEIILLLRILREVDRGTYETIVIDCPPTGAMFRMLTLSDAAMNKLLKLLEIERKVLKLLRPVSNRFRGLREMIPKDEFYRSLGDVLAEVARLGELLKKPEVTSLRLVLNPERVPVAETQRAYTYLGLFGFPVDAVFANKVFPDETAEGYFGNWRRVQTEQMELVRRSFLSTSIFEVRYLDREPIGIEELRALGREIYGERTPDEVLSEVRTILIDKDDGKPRLSLSLPSLDKSDLGLQRKNDELLISAGEYNRVLRLPDSLAGLEIESASYDDGRLSIVFA